MNEQIMERIDALAAKLGVVGAHLWEVLVRQAVIRGWVSVAWAVALLLLSYGALRLAESEEAAEEAAQAVLAIVYVLCVVASATVLTKGVMALLNPEYVAFKMLVP